MKKKKLCLPENMKFDIEYLFLQDVESRFSLYLEWNHSPTSFNNESINILFFSFLLITHLFLTNGYHPIHTHSL